MNLDFKKVLSIAVSAALVGSTAIGIIASAANNIDIKDSNSQVYKNLMVNGDFSDGSTGWHQGTRAGIDGLFDFDGAALPATSADFAAAVGTTVTSGKIDSVKNNGTSYTGTKYANPIWTIADVTGTDFNSVYGKALHKDNSAEATFRKIVDVNGNARLGDYNGVYQDLEGLKPNTRYMLYFDVATEESNAAGSANAAMIKVYSKSNGLVTDWTGTNNGNAQNGSGLVDENKCSIGGSYNWTSFQKEFTTTATEGEVYRIWIQAATAYMDNFVLVEAPMSMNLISNGGFETTTEDTATDYMSNQSVTKFAATGWLPTTRLNENNFYTWAQTRMMTVVKDASAAHSGSTYMSYVYDGQFSDYVDTNNGDRGRYTGFAQDITVNASKTYTLSFWFRNAGVSAANVKVIDQTALDPGNSTATNKYVNEQKVGSPDEWTYFEKTFTLDTIDYTTPYTPVKIDENGNTVIRIYIQGNTASDMYCDYDDICLYESVAASFEDSASGASIDLLRSNAYDYYATTDATSGVTTVEGIPTEMNVSTENNIFDFTFKDATGNYDISGAKVKITLPRASSGSLKYYDTEDSTWYDVDGNDIIPVGDNDVFTVENVSVLKFSYSENPGDDSGDPGDNNGSGNNGGGTNTGTDNGNTNTGTNNGTNSGTNNGTSNVTNNGNSPKTGDNTPFTAVAITGVTGIIALAAVVILKKKISA